MELRAHVFLLTGLLVSLRFTKTSGSILDHPDNETTADKIDIHQMARDLALHNVQLASLNNRLQNSINEVASLKNQLAAEQGNVRTLQTQVAALTNQTEIAFSARLAVTMEDIPAGSTVKFDRIIYNGGNGYDPQTGVFTCVKSGLYLFTMVIQAQFNTQRQDLPVALVIDGTRYAYAVSDPLEDGTDVQGVNTVVIHLNRGQRVWVETYYHDHISVFRTFSTFSGVLIHPTD